jgi:uncharacterized FlaG/YvyC family protein
MSENLINPIGNNYVRQATVTNALPRPQVKASVKEPSDQEKTLKKAENESEQVSGSSSVSVNFRINEDNELVAFIVDHNTHKVLRTIPVSEFYKMQAGELLKLAA